MMISVVFLDYHKNINPFVHNFEKRSKILLKSCSVDMAKFLKYVQPFAKIIHQKVNQV